MLQPNDATSLPHGITMSPLPTGTFVPSGTLVQLLVEARNEYDWLAGKGAAASQQTIINLEAMVSACMAALNPANAHRTVVGVSDWAGNNANSHARLVAATPA